MMDQDQQSTSLTLAEAVVKSFDKIYATDLVYKKDCWQLCGDAHCCSFSRYKTSFKLIARVPFQELPLLPGEFDYLRYKGWLAQFGDFDHKVVNYALDHRVMKVETIISRRPNCACDHDTRPTVCRLYPWLPIFDTDGRVIGLDSFGLYEEIESLDNLEPACKLTSLPFSELQKFLLITSEIGQNPAHLFFLTAYRLAKAHVRSQLIASKRVNGGSSLSLLERLMIRNKLINHSELKSELVALANTFEGRYGERFELS